MKRTNIALFVCVVALFAFITIHERFTIATSETASRADHLVPSLVRDRLESITVERGGARYVLARGARDADGNPTFGITEPFEAGADGERVLAALSDVEWAEPLRRLEGEGGAPGRYGLTRPRLRLTFEVGPERIVVAFGGDEPTTRGVYVRVDDAISVVPREVFEAFDRDVAHFRVRRFANALPEEPTSLRVRTARGEVRLAKRDGVFRVESPVRALASEGRANVVLSFLRTLEATRFVDERPTDLGRFGLASPSMDVVVGDERAPDAARLVVGGACEGHEGERYARFGDGPVVCVAADELTPLEVDPRAYLELRASATEAGGVRSVDLSDGRATLSVSLDEGGARYVLGATNGEANPEAVEAWLEGLRNTRAIEVIEGTSGFVPTTTWTVHRTATRPDDVMRFVVRPDGAVIGRRGDDGVLLRFPNELASRLRVTTIHVRDASLVREDPAALRSLTIERASGREVLRVEGESGLVVVEPVRVATEPGRAGDLAMRLAGLEAVRFVAESPAPEHGLDRPRMTVTFTFAGASGSETSHRLFVGATASSGHAYARLDDSPVVFELAAATLDLVVTPLASLGELRTESLFVDSAAVRVGGTTARIVRRGGSFAIEGATDDGARASAAADALAELRAVRVLGYGPPAASFGFSPPAAEIRVQRSAEIEGPRELVLTLGARTTVDGIERIAVRRADRDVTYEVDARAVEPLLALTR